MRLLGTLVTFLVMITSSCFAQSAALKDYDMLGTWSADCASSVTKGADRITFDVPVFGSPTMTELTSGGAIIITRISDIQSAEKITQDKIRLTIALRKFIGSAGPISIPSGDERAKPNQLLFEKLGQKFRVNALFLIERCLN
jgi:hypothetical protein